MVNLIDELLFTVIIAMLVVASLFQVSQIENINKDVDELKARIYELERRDTDGVHKKNIRWEI